MVDDSAAASLTPPCDKAANGIVDEVVLDRLCGCSRLSVAFKDFARLCVPPRRNADSVAIALVSTLMSHERLHHSFHLSPHAAMATLSTLG